MTLSATAERSKADILVIGGGIVGMTAAIAAAEEGASVVLVDAGVHAGSHTNAGSLHVQLQSRFLQLYPELAPGIEAALPLYVQAAHLWEDLEAKYDGVELVRTGGLMVAESDADLAFLQDKATREENLGLRVDILDQMALRSIAPYLGDHIIGAEICYDEGKVNPLIANKKLRAHAVASGVAIVTDHIQRIEPCDDQVSAIGKERYRGDQMILATAWGTGALTTDHGYALETRAEPLHMNITEPAEPILDHLVQHADRPLTLKQLQSGQIVIGGGWPAEHAANEPTPTILAKSLLGNLAIAGHLVPAIASLRILRTWAGLNTTVDGRSIVGRSERIARTIFAIPGDAGYTLGPLIGAAASAIALGHSPPFDPAPYSPDRFD